MDLKSAQEDCKSAVADLISRRNVAFSGQVYRGTWNKTPVALKTLKAEGGLTPSSQVGLRIAKSSVILLTELVLVGCSSRNYGKPVFFADS